MIGDEGERLREALLYVPPRERETWIRMGMAVKSELGDDGFNLWNEWSQADESYNEADARAVWRSISANGKVTAGTLFHEARRYGYAANDSPIQTRADDSSNRERDRAAEREAKRRDEAAEKALMIWRAAVPATDDHPYLRRKGVAAVSTLRTIDVQSVARILGYVPKSSGDLLTGSILVVPVKVGDSLSTLELIDSDGGKSAIAGGAKARGYWSAEPLPSGDGDGLTVQIGEGVATVLSAREATGDTSIAALSCSNLPNVAVAMRGRYPKANVVMLADVGNGQSYAEKAARLVGGTVAVPDFADDGADGEKDFNDLARSRGADAVRVAIANAKAPQPSDDEADARDGRAAQQWAPPLSLTVQAAPEPYPFDALPGMIGDAVGEVQAYTQAPIPLVASSALGALSLAAQAHVDIARDARLSGPVGLFLLTIADSGERKSSCDDYFAVAIRNYEREQAEAAAPDLKAHAANVDAWEAKRAGILDEIRKLRRKGSDTGMHEGALIDLQKAKPNPPRVPRLVYGDATPEALTYELAKHWPSAGVLSTEAGQIFGAHGMGRESIMRNLATLNELWGGRSLAFTRRTSESYTVNGARLTIALQVQEATLRAFFDKSEGLARGTGFFARFLLSWPESTIGYRPYREPPASWPALAHFSRRIAEILAMPAPIDDGGALSPLLLRLGPEAREAWIAFHDAIESELRCGGELYDVRDVASKAADNTARLAALFHVFRHGVRGAVDAKSFDSAGRIVAWHLNESRRFFGELALPDEIADAARLDAWLIEYCSRNRVTSVRTQTVQQFGPHGLRDRAAIEAAVQQLAADNRARLRLDGRRKEIQVNPALLSASKK